MTQLSDLIQQYAFGATPEGIKNLETLFDVLKRDRDKAEALERAAFRQVDVLLKRIVSLENGEKQPKQPRQVAEKPETQAEVTKPVVKKPSGAIEIEF